MLVSLKGSEWENQWKGLFAVQHGHGGSCRGDERGDC